MATLRSSLLPSHLHPYHRPSSLSLKPSVRLLPSPSLRKLPPPLLASSSDGPPPIGDAFSFNFDLSKRPLLADLIQEIEPLDVSLIQKDVPPTTLDAMKRTISGMLGLLPSNQFQVLIEALWEPISNLLVSSMMTGYTLRNAEYRLCLERNLGIHEEDCENKKSENSNFKLQGELENAGINESSAENIFSTKPQDVNEEKLEENGIEELGAMSPEAQQYIHHLKSCLSSAKKELHEVKRKNAALQMQQFVGEEKNELLDYLRSLQPEKVAELSEPTSPELKDTIHTVVHGLLATLSPKMHSKASPLLGGSSSGTVNIGSENWAELVENSSLQFQPHVSLFRDYLARLLFWCMLLGHYLRGLEYRMELTELLSLTKDVGNEDD